MIVKYFQLDQTTFPFVLHSTGKVTEEITVSRDGQSYTSQFTTQIYRPDGTLKPPDDLRTAMTAAGLNLDRPIITTCGSGVTACHNLLALSHAGIVGAKLFAPSWSGWVSDDANPVAVGA